MKKLIITSIVSVTILAGCDSVPEENLQYAKDLAYCSGVTYAVKRHPETRHGVMLDDSQLGIAVAREITNSADTELIKAFNNGYNSVENRIAAVDRSTINEGDNFVEWDRISLMPSTCKREINITPVTNKTLANIPDSSLTKVYIEDLSSWLN
ncbi:hypothetical protein DSB67_05210 [Vibrio campbellii]|uniref:hypothetical protein n=1 Tax=Vibrio campbellii TaxID=680 RepID=UPI00026C49D1|nr:hypothetical protein [Vibrio campbellii]AXB31008.1 hypothetical protein DSB67_05210 [Vibrio campbellii]